MIDAQPTYELANKRVWVAGHRGMVGSAIVRRLAREGCEVLTAGRAELDLRDGAAVRAWLLDRRPQVVFMAAAKVGGILANDTYPAQFLYENLMIEANVTHNAHVAGVEKLLFLGSSCIYPKLAPQPLREEALLTGPLEPTNEWYAIAKIAGVKLAQAYRREHGCDFISAMPTNLYGPGDNFDLQSSHVLPALLAKIHDAHHRGADEVTIWGSGRPYREFLYVEDLADACVFLMRRYSAAEPVNVGTGEDVTIAELATRLAQAVGYRGGFTYDASKPDGTPRKRLDVGKLDALGWRAQTSLEDGVRRTYDWFKQRAAEPRGSGSAADESSGTT